MAPKRPQLQPITSQRAISIEEWEGKAPLSDVETASVNVLKLACERVPFPAKVQNTLSSSPTVSLNEVLQFRIEEESHQTRSSTPVRRIVNGDESRPGSSSSNYRPPMTHALHPRESVQTPQQFYDWFSLVERSVAHSEEAHFHAYVAEVSERLETCDQLVENLDRIDAEVEGMLESWRAVERGGKSLKEA